MYAYNLDRKALRMEADMQEFFLARELNLTSTNIRLTTAKGTFQVTGGKDAICRSFGRGIGFHDQFSWAANPLLSAFEGAETVHGRPCNRWRLRAPAVATQISLCADGDEPVQLSIKSPMTQGQFFNLTYGELTAVGPAVDPSLFVVPSACDGPAPPCAAARGLGPREVEVYVFHPGMSAVDYDIADQNVADLDGDALFICSDALQPQRNSSFVDHNYTRISRYTLLVSPAFGQYGLCNGYPDTAPPGPICLGGDARLVGREAPLFAGDGELRCAAESPIGFWYSLPRSGQCPPGQSPGANAWREGCTWSVQKRLKTVDQNCLLKKHRLPDKCVMDLTTGKGFGSSAQALGLAFASENVSAGGCPDIGGPPQEEANLIV